MVYLLLALLALFYVGMALRFFSVWLAVFRQDTSVSPQEPGSLMIIVLITIFWPVVVPFAYLELLTAKKTAESFCLTREQLLTIEEESTKYK